MSSVIMANAIRQWRSCREAFEEYRESAYAAAEAETNGVLVNRRGKRAGIEAYSLFIGSDMRAYAYASDELIEYWERRPRLTFEKFEMQWLKGEDQ